MTSPSAEITVSMIDHFVQWISYDSKTFIPLSPVGRSVHSNVRFSHLSARPTAAVGVALGLNQEGIFRCFATIFHNRNRLTPGQVTSEKLFAHVRETSWSREKRVSFRWLEHLDLESTNLIKVKKNTCSCKLICYNKQHNGTSAATVLSSFIVPSHIITGLQSRETLARFT